MTQVCTVCGTVSDGPRCSKHPQSNRGTRNPFYSTPEWLALKARVIRAWVGQYGWVCPGDGPEHPAHPVAPHKLTGDHILAMELGGAPLDPANVRPMCLSWNSTLGARLVNAKRAGVLLPAVPPVLDERAQIRARYLG